MAGLWQWAVNKLDAAEQWLVDEVLVGWNPSQVPSLHGKVAVVTGANSGIGYEATRKLAENGAEVYMVVRNMEKGQDALEKITKELGPVKLHLLHADMECMSQVQRAAQQLRSVKVDILINNAGVLCPGPFRMTQEGLEQTLAIDFYSAALLALGTIDCMAQGGRIVFVSSEAEWPLGAFASFDNMRGDKFKDSGITPYAVAKVWEIMFAKELAERVRHKGIDVFAVHPGVVFTPGSQKVDVKNYLAAKLISVNARVMGQTPYHGAWSMLYAATAPPLTGKGFGYFGPNLLGMWHATERQPGTWAAHNPVTCWRLFEEAVKVMEDILGSGAMPSVPRHPDRARDAMLAKRSCCHGGGVQHHMATAA
ncbi:WW domain-containing oxidoreductase [Haematococcus lacustris]|uniref:WW domain-containing oxidoreductase n=1 Tax=Haematococcus lacustris TaxID=44745 RepID=A0A699Y7L4_HAELA|nr:WW domain-containing oxidoreductase [Haematococcus lacustris]